MKTYIDECVELIEWCKKSLQEAEEEVSKIPKTGGRDDSAAPIMNKVWHEWNRRAVSLKIKHNMPLTEQEEKWRV